MMAGKSLYGIFLGMYFILSDDCTCVLLAVGTYSVRTSWVFGSYSFVCLFQVISLYKCT